MSDKESKIPALDRKFEKRDIINEDYPATEVESGGCDGVRKIRTVKEHEEWRKEKLSKPLP